MAVVNYFIESCQWSKRYKFNFKKNWVAWAKVEVLESANLNFHIELESQGLDYNKKFINSYENTKTKTFKIDVEVYKEFGFDNKLEKGKWRPSLS